MKGRYFVKYLATFLIPLLIPLIILGSLSFVTTQHQMKNDINRSNRFLLLQSQRQLEMILHDLDTLKLALYQNAKVYNELSLMLKQPYFTYESAQSYQIIINFMNALTSAKPYIDSIYFYANNPYGRFISSNDGISSLDHFKDTEWYRDFMEYGDSAREWTTRRRVEMDGFALPQTELVTIYNVIAPQKIGIFLNIRPAYIEGLLSNITTYSGQKLLVMDESNHVIFANTQKIDLGKEELVRIADNPESFFDTRSSLGKINVTKVEADRYSWKYISIIPHSSLYEVPSRILYFTVLLSGLSFAFGLLLTFYLTRRNYRQLLAITSLIRSAENNRTPLRSPTKVKDEYSYIIQNMVKHFIEHRYIQTQLSEKKYRLQVMELMALQSQINPHFLYNTLHSVYWESVALTGRPNKASEMIEDLSNILSYSFSNPTMTVTWADEIANSISYLNIQRKRYKDKFDVIFEYDEEIASLYTMKLILQPLLENSLYHGIKEKETFGLIKVKIIRKGDELRVVVLDNGLGIPPKRLDEIVNRLHNDEEGARHVGLYNTNKRLKLIYEDRHRFRITSKPGFGTRVEIIIPIREANDLQSKV